MKFEITRDSVCAGDDVDAPHKRIVKCGQLESVAECIEFVIQSVRLPKIDGGMAVWALWSKRPLAVIAQQWEQPQNLVNHLDIDDLDRDDDLIRMHFVYLTQHDPDIVVDVLRRLPQRVAEGN